MTAATEPDAAAVAAFWTAFTQATGTTGEPGDVFGFGDSAEMADRLADLVLVGTKRATAGLVVDQGELDVQVGMLSVVHRGDGTPVAVIRTTDIRRGPLSSVDDAFAWDEGEGDRTRDYWLRGHARAFRRGDERAGRPVQDDPMTAFERFEVVWPPEVADG